MKLISIVTGCYNEEDNVNELHARLTVVRERLANYRFEHIFIDNASTDRTVSKVKALIDEDPAVKLIVNNRNFGHIRSPYHAMLQARGDAVICMASDLQDPPELIQEMIGAWERGFSVVAAVKRRTKESRAMWLMRSIYYQIARKIADVQLLEHFTGFGLYDRKVVETLRGLNDPYPYFRGLIAEMGFDIARIPFDQPSRNHGFSKSNFYILYDLAMLGLTSHSKIPIRLATMAGFAMSILSLLISLMYLVLKLILWNQFLLGTAPLLIGMFFFGSVQLFFIGLIGEYVASIHTQILRRPLVIERERINFDEPMGKGGAESENLTGPGAASA